MKKRKRNVSILFVSDDKNEPVGIKLSSGVFRIVLVGIALVFLLIIFGAVYYFKVLGILADYDNMKERIKQFEVYKKMVYRIEKKFESIENTDQQIRKLFGEKTYNQKKIEGVENKDEGKKESAKFVSDDVNFFLDENYNKTNIEKVSVSSKYIPYLIPAEGFITKDFQKDDFLIEKSHTGIDIVAKEGTVIRCVANGVVIFSNWTYEGGNTIIVDHLNGFISFYKHNKRLLVGERMFVKRGQPIALMGNSGVSSGTHLHFEIWKNGMPVDPKDYIINF
jgi:murein DD-endopeptidase MepM/ murein hydrolase activator NlpD